MKKILALLLVFTVFLAGCSMDKKESPKEKVAVYLDSYNKLDDNVLTDLDDLVDDMRDYTSGEKERYKTLMKKHYEDLKYKIKSETIEDDQAIVEVEIEVRDYSKILKNDDIKDEYLDEDGKYDLEAFYDDQLDSLEKVKDTVKYTILFNLSKQDGEWVIDQPNEVVMQKIHGIYAY